MDSVEFFRLVSKFTVGDDCWRWIKPDVSTGYGVKVIDGKNKRAHRVVYEMLVGPIADGLELDHTCHTEDADCAGGVTCPHRACVNPAHLLPVPSKENKRRGNSPSAKNAVKDNCDNDHPLSGANLYLRPDGKGRECRTCRYAAVVKHREGQAKA